MNPKAKRLLIPTIILIVLMFIWIGVAVLLTGGRDVGEFTATDKKIMMAFLIVEIVTIVLVFVFAYLTGRANRDHIPKMTNIPTTKSEKTIRFRSIGLSVSAVVLSLGIQILGIVLGKACSDGFVRICAWLSWVCIGVSFVLLILNQLLLKSRTAHLNQQKIAQIHKFIVSHRETAEQTAAEKYAVIKRWKQATDLYAVIISALAVTTAFSSGVNYNGTATVLCMLAALLFLCAFSRIRFQTPKSFFDEEKTYVAPEEYPKLYALAAQAADTIGCEGTIRIAVLPDANAGIAKIRDIYSIQIGATLMHALSEEELYHILLHEFSHMEQQKNIAQKEQQYFNWLNNGQLPFFASGIVHAMFAYFDYVYMWEYMLYMYAATIQIETKADQAMARFGDPQIAASALLKLKYHELFCWEKGHRDEKNLYIPEEPDKQIVSDDIAEFLQQIPVRSGDWDMLADVEILSRSASHPTLKMRLDSLGVSKATALPAVHSEGFAEECSRAVKHLEELVYENRKESYADNRKALYLEPLETVERWEAAGKPLIAEEYGDVVWSLRKLARTEEAIALCQQAIDALPAAASCQAYFLRGSYRLYGYDPAGLDDIYFAIEHNPNYIEEGMNIIGNFCCLTGNQEELDCYREKAAELAQKEKDVYSQIGKLEKNDNLQGETLPEGMLEEILEYIHTIENGEIQKLYLVRKTITADFFTSALVVHFCPNVQEDAASEILHKIFCYLDTSSDWQFSLFDYRDVASVKVERIENSCIYEKKES